MNNPKKPTNTSPKIRTIKKRDPETGEVISVEVPIAPPLQIKRRDAVTGEILNPGEGAPAEVTAWKPWTPPTTQTPPPTSPPNRKFIGGVVGAAVLAVGMVVAYPTLQEMQYWRGVDCAVADAVQGYTQTYPNGRYKSEAAQCTSQIDTAEAAAEATAKRIANEKAAAEAKRIANLSQSEGKDQAEKAYQEQDIATLRK